MPALTYLRLLDTSGTAPTHTRTPAGLEVPNPRAGELDELNNIGVNIPIPTMVDGEIVNLTAPVSIRQAQKLEDGDVDVSTRTLLRARIIPGTRIIETDCQPVIDLLQEMNFVHCDPPKTTTRKPAAAGNE